MIFEIEFACLLKCSWRNILCTPVLPMQLHIAKQDSNRTILFYFIMFPSFSPSVFSLSFYFSVILLCFCYMLKLSGFSTLHCHWAFSINERYIDCCFFNSFSIDYGLNKTSIRLKVPYQAVNGQSCCPLLRRKEMLYCLPTHRLQISGTNKLDILLKIREIDGKLLFISP